MRDATVSGTLAFGIIAVSIHASVIFEIAALVNGIYTITVVSIHASVRDATNKLRVIIEDLEVSIHASVRDATIIGLFYIVFSSSFNPRIREGCDNLTGGMKMGNKVFQSTHP